MISEFYLSTTFHPSHSQPFFFGSQLRCLKFGLGGFSNFGNSFIKLLELPPILCFMFSDSLALIQKKKNWIFIRSRFRREITPMPQSISDPLFAFHLPSLVAEKKNSNFYLPLMVTIIPRECRLIFPHLTYEYLTREPLPDFYHHIFMQLFFFFFLRLPSSFDEPFLLSLLSPFPIPKFLNKTR